METANPGRRISCCQEALKSSAFDELLSKVKANTIRTIMKIVLIKVLTFCNRLLCLIVKLCIKPIKIIIEIANHTLPCSPKGARYFVKAIAANATGAEKPTVNPAHADKYPNIG